MEIDAREPGGPARAQRHRSPAPGEVDRSMRPRIAGRLRPVRFAAIRTRRRLRQCRALPGGEEKASPRAVPDAVTDYFPWGAGARIGVRFNETPVEVVSLLNRELEAFILFGDAVPELLDELEPLGDR